MSDPISPMTVIEAQEALDRQIHLASAEEFQLKAKLECYRRVIEAFKQARAAWIHHVCAPDILRELWSLQEPYRVCTHTVKENKSIVACPDWDASTFIVAPWAKGYEYCTHCGAMKEIA